MYATVNSLVYLQGNTSVIRESQERVHQGDPLGPALFSTAIHSYLSSLQEKNSEIKVLAYLNDVFLLGDASKVLSRFSDLKSCLLEIGLEIAVNKCEIYCQSSSAYKSILDCQLGCQGSLTLSVRLE